MSPKVSSATPTGGLVSEVSETEVHWQIKRDGNRDHGTGLQWVAGKGARLEHHDLVTGSSGRSYGEKGGREVSDVSDWTPWEEGSGTKEIQGAKGQALGIGVTPEFKNFVGQWVSKMQTNIDSFTQ